HEIDIINKKGLIWGFLVIWDFIRFAKTKNIMISPGCGALPGSLVAYSLGITGINPVQENLLFERYLNEESEPYTYRIEINVEKGAKALLSDYISEKYGHEMPKILEMADIQIKECIDLSIIRETMEKIHLNHGISVDIYSIDKGDSAVYEYFCSEAQNSVFCFDKNDAKKYIPAFDDEEDAEDYCSWEGYLVPMILKSKVLFGAIKPASFDELVAAISLSRDLPEHFIRRYVINQYASEEIEYECAELESILSETYGCILYQEQIMLILQKMAGFSPEQSNKCRRALSKHATIKIREYRLWFINGNPEEKIQGCKANGIPKTAAWDVFERLSVDAGYVFNKAHAICYSQILFTMVWLSFYYELEFQEVIDKWRRPLCDGE
ncbi:MAG: hypothetical protein K5776_03670, partial [Lachnospiraceae bacterium]|nr:hypothetical protein [Lachnospiraceae bacterium]